MPFSLKHKWIVFFLSLIFFSQPVLPQSLLQSIEYRFNISSKSRNNLNTLFTPSDQSNSPVSKISLSRFSGKLMVTKIKEEKGEFLFAATIQSPRYLFQSEESTVSELDSNYLKQDIYYWTREGKISRIFLLSGTPEAESNIIKGLLSYLQYSVPPGNNLKNWKDKEDDLYGHCNTLYELAPSSPGLLLLSKKKTGYFSLKNEPNTIQIKTRYIPVGSCTACIDKKSQALISIDGHEKITTTIGRRNAGVLETDFYLRGNITRLLPADSLNHYKQFPFNIQSGYSETGLYHFISHEEFVKLVRKNTLGIDSFESILNRLATDIRPGSVDSFYKDSVYLKTRALATVYPATCKQLASILDTTEANSPTYFFLCRSLLDAENKESVNALAMLLPRHLEDWNYEKKILTNLGLSKIITDTLIRVYKQLSSVYPSTKLSRTAQIALGTMVDNLNETDPAGSKELLQWIFSESAKMGFTIKECRQKLLVWGNTNAREAFDSIRSYQHHKEIEIRNVVASVIALFKIPGKTPALLQIIQKDSSRDVRITAAEGLMNQVAQKAEIEKLTILVRNEKDTSTRISLVNCFDATTVEKPLLKKMLVRILEKEDCYTVKTYVTALLRKLEQAE